MLQSCRVVVYMGIVFDLLYHVWCDWATLIKCFGRWTDIWPSRKWEITWNHSNCKSEFWVGWLSRFHLSCWIDPVEKMQWVHVVILTVPWWPCCTSISQFHESMEAVNIPKRQLPISFLAFQDDEWFHVWAFAEGPTETFQNIPCVLSHVKSTLSIDFLVSQQPLGHGYYWTWPRGHSHGGLILDLGPKVGEYEVHHLWIPRRWCTDALEWRSGCCVVHYHFSLYLMFMRMYVCVSIYIICII